MKRKLWILLALAALIAALGCGTALAEEKFITQPTVTGPIDEFFKREISWEVNFTPTKY